MVRNKSKRLRGTKQDNFDQQQRGARKQEPKATGHFSNFEIRGANNVNVGSSTSNVKGPPILFINMAEMNGESMSEFVYALAIRLTGGFNHELSYENSGPDQSDILFSQACPLTPETDPGAYPNRRRHRDNASTTRGQYTDGPIEKCPGDHTQQDVITSPPRHEARIDRLLEDHETPEGQKQKKSANSKQSRPPQTQVKAGPSRNSSGQHQEKKDWRLSLRPRKRPGDQLGI